MLSHHALCIIVTLLFGFCDAASRGGGARRRQSPAKGGTSGARPKGSFFTGSTKKLNKITKKVEKVCREGEKATGVSCVEAEEGEEFQCDLHEDEGEEECMIDSAILKICTPVVQDMEPECPEWASNGECDTNEEFMLEACRKSCGFSYDKVRKLQAKECSSLEKDGECKASEEWMKCRCKALCGGNCFGVPLLILVLTSLLFNLLAVYGLLQCLGLEAPNLVKRGYELLQILLMWVIDVLLKKEEVLPHLKNIRQILICILVPVNLLRWFIPLTDGACESIEADYGFSIIFMILFLGPTIFLLLAKCKVRFCPRIMARVVPVVPESSEVVIK